MPKKIIDEEYLDKLKALDLIEDDENNPRLVLKLKGDGAKVTEKFNIRVYKNKKDKLLMIHNDDYTLERLVNHGGLVADEGKRLIFIDDAAWSFPIGGALCGVYDKGRDEYHWREIEVRYFQGKRYKRKKYMDRFRERTMEIIHDIDPDKKKTKIKICTGAILEKAKRSLRSEGYIVDIEEIGEPLQTWLEERARRYVEEVADKDIYYDPKEVPRKDLGKRYRQVLGYIRKKGLYYLAKGKLFRRK